MKWIFGHVELRAYPEKSEIVYEASDKGNAAPIVRVHSGNGQLHNAYHTVTIYKGESARTVLLVLYCKKKSETQGSCHSQRTFNIIPMKHG